MVSPQWLARTRSEQLRRHVFEIGFAVYGVIAGLSALLTLWTGYDLILTPLWLDHRSVALLGTILVVGSAWILVGIFDVHCPDLSRSWHSERFGLMLSSIAWAAYGVILFWHAPPAYMTWLYPFLLATQMLIRYNATLHDEHRVRKTILGEDDDDERT